MNSSAAPLPSIVLAEDGTMLHRYSAASMEDTMALLIQIATLGTVETMPSAQNEEGVGVGWLARVIQAGGANFFGCIGPGRLGALSCLVSLCINQKIVRHPQYVNNGYTLVLTANHFLWPLPPQSGQMKQ